MKDKYYLLVTNDKYELVTACSDTLVKLSVITGIKFDTLYKSMYRGGTCCRNKYRVISTHTDVKDYDCNIPNYLLFCKDFHLEEKSPVSILLFKTYSDCIGNSRQSTGGFTY